MAPLLYPQYPIPIKKAKAGDLTKLVSSYVPLEYRLSMLNCHAVMAVTLLMKISSLSLIRSSKFRVVHTHMHTS